MRIRSLIATEGNGPSDCHDVAWLCDRPVADGNAGSGELVLATVLLACATFIAGRPRPA